MEWLHPILVGGWAYPSEKYDFVSWDDDIPKWMESHKIPWFQTTNQTKIPYPSVKKLRGLAKSWMKTTRQPGPSTNHSCRAKRPMADSNCCCICNICTNCSATLIGAPWGCARFLDQVPNKNFLKRTDIVIQATKMWRQQQYEVLVSKQMWLNKHCWLNQRLHWRSLEIWPIRNSI